jgi:hypothetical protein
MTGACGLYNLGGSATRGGSASAPPRACPRGYGPEVTRAAAGRSSPVRSPKLARALGSDLAHALFPGELGRGGSLFSGKLVGGEGGGRRMQRGGEGDEQTSARRDTGGPRGLPLCLVAVGKQSFWVGDPFVVHNLNPRVGRRFAFSLLESVLGFGASGQVEGLSEKMKQVSNFVLTSEYNLH